MTPSQPLHGQRIPLADLLPAEKIDESQWCVLCTGGAEVVALLKTGSAFYALLLLRVCMAKAVIEDSGAVIMPVCALGRRRVRNQRCLTWASRQSGRTGIRS
jgi:malate dehydrogenase